MPIDCAAKAAAFYNGITVYIAPLEFSDTATLSARLALHTPREEQPALGHLLSTLDSVATGTLNSLVEALEVPARTQGLCQQPQRCAWGLPPSKSTRRM